MITIKGVWVFNEQPDWSYTPTEIYVSFTSNGSAYIGMTCNTNPVDYMIAGGSTVSANTGDRWVDDAYRTVDFGETEQEVPDDFYAWFTANAVYQDVDPEPGPSPIVGTLKEEALKLRQNLDKIYEAGKAAGGGGGGYTQEELDQAVADATEQGKQAENDRFWDAYQNNGGNYKDAFSGPSWKDEVYNPNKPIVCTVSAEYAFSESKITDTKVPIEVRGCSANYMFMSCSDLKTIPLIGFYGVTGNSTFMAYSFNLENITFAGEIPYSIGFGNCAKLTNASVQSIIDHLKDHTGSASVKIVFHSDVVSKMTAEQLAQIQSKNWYVG